MAKGDKKKRSLSKNEQKAVKKIVKRELASEIAQKTVTYGPDLGNLLPIGDANWVQNNVFSLSPDNANGPLIVQGSEQGERDGNIIKIKKCYLDFVLTALPYSADNLTPEPCIVQMVIFRQKQTNTFPPTSNTTMGNFWQDGSTSDSIVGTTGDLCRVINDDVYIEYHREEYKIGYKDYEGTGSQAAFQYFANNDFKLLVHRKIDVTKWLHKRVCFNDSFVPTTPNTLVLFNMMSYDGSTIATGEQPIQISLAVNMYFTNA